MILSNTPFTSSELETSSGFTEACPLHFDATASRIVGESALIKNRQKLAIKYLDKFDESKKLQILKISINSASADRFHELEKEIITAIVEHYKFSYEKIFFSN